MYSSEDIKKFIEIIVEVAEPDKVILFGSYAYGSPSDRSDVDLLVIKNGKKVTFDDEVELSCQIFNRRIERHIDIDYDIFFQTEEQARETAGLTGGAFVDALQKGVVMYERDIEQTRRIAI